MFTVRDELAELLRSVNREMHESLKLALQGMQGYCFTPVSMFLLRNVHLEPGVTMSDLARRSGLVKSHVSKLVDHFVQEGLVEKRSDPDDQRLVRIYPTKASHDLKAALESRVKAVLNELPAQEAEEIARGLRTLLRALQKSNEKVKP